MQPTHLNFGPRISYFARTAALVLALAEAKCTVLYDFGGFRYANPDADASADATNEARPDITEFTDTPDAGQQLEDVLQTKDRISPPTDNEAPDVVLDGEVEIDASTLDAEAGLDVPQDRPGDISLDAAMDVFDGGGDGGVPREEVSVDAPVDTAPVDRLPTPPSTPTISFPRIGSTLLSGTRVYLRAADRSGAETYNFEVTLIGDAGGSRSIRSSQVRAVTDPLSTGNYSVRVNACNTGGCSDYSSPQPFSIATGSPATSYPLTEGTGTIFNAEGSPTAAGNLTAPFSWLTDGPLLGGVRLTESGSMSSGRLTFSDSNIMNVRSANFGFSFWVNLDSAGDQVFFRKETDTTTGLSIGLSASNIYFDNSGCTRVTGNTLSVRQPVNIFIRRETGSVTISLNGIDGTASRCAGNINYSNPLFTPRVLGILGVIKTYPASTPSWSDQVVNDTCEVETRSSFPASSACQ